MNLLETMAPTGGDRLPASGSPQAPAPAGTSHQAGASSACSTAFVEVMKGAGKGLGLQSPPHADTTAIRPLAAIPPACKAAATHPAGNAKAEGQQGSN